MTGTPVTANGVGVGTLVTANVSCAAGKVALGGGGRITVSGVLESSVAMRSSYPSAASTWTVVAIVTASLLSGSTTVTPYVLCSL